MFVFSESQKEKGSLKAYYSQFCYLSIQLRDRRGQHLAFVSWISFLKTVVMLCIESQHVTSLLNLMDTSLGYRVLQRDRTSRIDDGWMEGWIDR